MVIQIWKHSVLYIGRGGQPTAHKGLAPCPPSLPGINIAIRPAKCNQPQNIILPKTSVGKHCLATLRCPSPASSSSLLVSFQTTLRTFNASWPYLAAPFVTVANNSSQKLTIRSLAFPPSSRTATSMTFSCCLPHPSSQTLKILL